MEYPQSLNGIWIGVRLDAVQREKTEAQMGTVGDTVQPVIFSVLSDFPCKNLL